MKIAIVLCAVIGASLALPYESYGKSVNTGRSQVQRKDDGHGNYEFAYDEEHHEGGTSRREKGGKGWQTGSYELRDKDGRKRTVKYVADAHGFRAKVDTNEPGTDDKEDPADVDMDVQNSYNNYNDYNNNKNYNSYQSYEPQVVSYVKSYSEPEYSSYSAPSGYDSKVSHAQIVTIKKGY